MKVKIYIMHSSKVDYKNKIYKPLLESGIMKDFFLILPRSERFFSYYVKDLIKDSDSVICDLTNINFSLKIEMKWASKLNKNIFYVCDKKYKLKLKLDNINYYSSEEELINIVQTHLNSLNKKELLLKRDNIYCLGNINRK